jgi:hypothetical protein
MDFIVKFQISQNEALIILEKRNTYVLFIPMKTRDSILLSHVPLGKCFFVYLSTHISVQNAFTGSSFTGVTPRLRNAASTRATKSHGPDMTLAIVTGARSFCESACHLAFAPVTKTSDGSDPALHALYLSTMRRLWLLREYPSVMNFTRNISAGALGAFLESRDSATPNT